MHLEIEKMASGKLEVMFFVCLFIYHLNSVSMLVLHDLMKMCDCDDWGQYCVLRLQYYKLNKFVSGGFQFDLSRYLVGLLFACILCMFFCVVSNVDIDYRDVVTLALHVFHSTSCHT